VLHREPTDLEALLREVAAAYRGQAEQGGVRLAVEVAGEVPPVDVDPARIREVLANLLTNAIRHTPRDGSVELSAAVDGRAVEVIVRDTGSGMTPEQLDRVFDRFYRAADSPGSGLGLPIAHDLVQAHGGEMSVTSEPGHGTAVRFTLPVVPDPARTAVFE
jgi:two-component system sensor histidine kinase BaeS